jgi:mono/diheme cytochrome c family protein
MKVVWRPWGFGSALLGLVAVLGFVAASSAVPSAQVAAGPAAASVKPVTFTKDIAPILQEHCQNCHRPDQMAPMSLVAYEDARPYARSIKTRTAARAMPPWHVERNIGIQKFKDDPSLTDAEIATIGAWVDQGAPKGNMADMPAPKQFDADDMWHFKPDLIVEMPVVHIVPANSPDVFMDFISDSGLTEDRYVRAVETKPGPGARGVTHHLLTYLIQDVDPSEKLIGVDDVRGGSNETFLNEYAVGKNGDILPEGTGKLMKAGAKIRFSTHYHASGKETGDRSRVAVQFYPKGYVPKYHQISLQIAHADSGDNLDLPPGMVTRSDGYYRFDKPVHITAIQAHMHNLGKRMCVEAILPTNTTDQLNCVGWDFNWHKVYVYADDVSPLYPAGTVLHTTLWHDNSAANRADPDPRNWRGFGQRTLDEMAFAWITWSNLTEADYKDMVAARKKLNSN